MYGNKFIPVGLHSNLLLKVSSQQTPTHGPNDRRQLTIAASYCDYEQ